MRNILLDSNSPYGKIAVYGIFKTEDSIIKPNRSKPEIQSNPAKTYRVTSLDKALSVLELVIDQGRDLSITEISQKLGMMKGTVHRVLSTLTARKFIQQNSRTKMYGLGVRTLEIGMDSKRERFLRIGHGPLPDGAPRDVRGNSERGGMGI